MNFKNLTSLKDKKNSFPPLLKSNYEIEELRDSIALLTRIEKEKNLRKGRQD